MAWDTSKSPGDVIASAEWNVMALDQKDRIDEDGTIPLTANWDAGAFEIRAETFQSDIATGTAPFIVASTTVVANLNVDQVDGHDMDQDVLIASDVQLASLTLGNTGLHILDTNSSHDLVVVPGSDLTVDRNLTLTTGDAARTITLNGDPTLNDWFDQSVKQAADVIFATATLNNTGLHLLDTNASHDLIIAPGSDITADRTLTLTTGDADRTLTLSGNSTIDDWFDQALKQASSPQFVALTLTEDISAQGMSAQELDVEYIVDTAPQTYTNGQHEGLAVRATRDTVGNSYHGYVDIIAGRSSDLGLGGGRFRFFSQPMTLGDPILAMMIDHDGAVSITEDLSAAGGFKQPFNFMQTDVAASQTAVALNVLGLSGNTEVVMPYAGSVIGISVASNDARTAGTLTLDATIDGTVTGLQVVLDDDPTTYASNTQAKDTDTFTVGQRVGVKITTDGDWTPVTADIVVTVIIEM